MKKKSLGTLLLVLMFSFSSSASALSLNSADVSQVLTILAQICKITGALSGNKIPYCETLAEVTPALNDMTKGVEGITRGGDLMSFIDNGTKLWAGGISLKDSFSKDKSVDDVNNTKNATDTAINAAYTTGLAAIKSVPTTNPANTAGQALALAGTSGAVEGLNNAVAGVQAADVLANSNGTRTIQTAADRAITASEDGKKLLEQSNLAVSTRATIAVTNEILVKMLDHTMSNNLNMTSLIASSVQGQALTTQQIGHLVNAQYKKEGQENAGSRADLEEMQLIATNTGTEVSGMFSGTSTAIANASVASIRLSSSP
jgi:hypothetical protein